MQNIVNSEFLAGLCLRKIVYGKSDKVMGDEIFNVFPEISTKRLNLREIKHEDAESIYKLLSNPEVIKYDTFELFTNIKQAEDMIRWFNDAFKQKRAIFWGISLKNESEIIGFCKCEIEIPKVRADLGYDLRPEYNHQANNT